MGHAHVTTVVAALDSFKGSLTSAEAGEAVRRGVLSVEPGARVVVVPVADGGEGTLEAVATATSSWVEVDTADAVGAPLRAPYLLLEDGSAVVEAARTVGLAQVSEVGPSLPPRASSYGVGLQLAHALAHGAGGVLIGLGGSACTDGGIGLLVALGVAVDTTTPTGNPLWGFASVGGGLPDLSRVVVLSDVTNPLHGPAGAARVFAPQKGASPDQVEHLDAQLVRWGDALAASGHPVADASGAGAAGGLGAALLACGAEVVPGFTRIAQATGLAATLADADLVFTGEGSLDGQTALGKAPLGVARLARAAGAVVVGLGGAVERPARPPFDAVFPIHGRVRSLAAALDPALARAELAATAAEVVRLVGSARR